MTSLSAGNANIIGKCHTNDESIVRLKIENLTKRPDISVWYKSRKELLAVIEIKRAWRTAPVEGDMRRLLSMTQIKHGPKHGYMIVYSERRNDATLENNFGNWEEATDGELIHGYVSKHAEEGWHWGFCILKV